MKIGLIGHAGSGKSTVAKFLVENYGFARTPFAFDLKNMLASLGLGKDELDGHLKEQPSQSLLGHTPRHAMQTLGTEWGRKCLGDDFWVRRWQARAASLPLAVADDCRFLNEAGSLWELGGAIIRVERPGHEPEKKVARHESEREMKLIVEDYTVINDGTLDNLYHQVDEIMISLLPLNEFAGE